VSGWISAEWGWGWAECGWAGWGWVEWVRGRFSDDAVEVADVVSDPNATSPTLLLHGQARRARPRRDGPG
jgi:hypothetical protein